MMCPLSERREYLRQAVADSDSLAVSRIYGADQAMELFNLTQAQGLEGIVAKKKDSLYFQGKRTKSWLKMKHLMDDDFVVCGYIDKGDHMVAASDRDGVICSLSAGNCGDGPEGRALLRQFGPVDHPVCLLMDRAYEGDETRAFSTELCLYKDSSDSISYEWKW